ncbi:hypothetical protein INT48_004693 [Thamnidium elegans]|uniref:Uncharacterized protein n=1 Tax=Thamnidium elegans TaxID=101142 RepID=A0A8H7SUE4_9FUNG|nr:hypothetical protein INT48_004693 [Thamnidium elegans]
MDGVGKIPKEELLVTKGKAVLIDPGRRDLLYCMHEDKCENKLNQYSSSTVNADVYVEYLKVRDQVSPILEEYYGNEDVEKNQRQDNLIPFRKMKLSSYINQIQVDKRLSEMIVSLF